MNIMLDISNLIIPFLVLGVILYGYFQGIDVYSCFIEGCKEGMQLSIKIFPYLLAMMLSVNIFVESNVLDVVYQLINPILSTIDVDPNILPVAILRPISGTSTLALINNIFIESGPDSVVGKMVSTIQGSTDTTFYVLTLYFGSVGIKNSRYAMHVGLFADFVGIVSSIILVKLLF